MSRARIAEAVSAGEITRIRQGWYANPWLPPAQCQAARIGGQLACTSAAAALGLWEPRAPALHVVVPTNAKGLRSPRSYRAPLPPGGAEVHWTGLDPRGSRVLVSVAGCLEQVARCSSPEVALAVAESALHRRRISQAQWRAVLASVPAHLRAALAGASGLSESGTESLFVFGMARAGIDVRQQVVIEGVGRVDCLIGERLVIELDSFAHHSDPMADRRRDAVLSARGYRVLRFMYHQVVDEWPSVQAAVLAAIARGDHLP
jgi:hypothetical protein